VLILESDDFLKVAVIHGKPQKLSDFQESLFGFLMRSIKFVIDFHTVTKNRDAVASKRETEFFFVKFKMTHKTPP